MPQEKPSFKLSSAAVGSTTSTNTGTTAPSSSSSSANNTNNNNSGKSGLAPKHQYRRTASGTAIRGPLTMETDASSFFHFDSGGMSALKGTPTKATTPSGSALPPSLRVRLYELFVQIEHEFEVLYSENLGLQERVEWLSRSQSHQQITQHSSLLQNNRSFGDQADVHHPTVSSIMNSMASNLPKSMSRGIYAHKIRSHTNKLRQHTTKIMSNLKGPPTIHCLPSRRYAGHKDGVWEVSVSKLNMPILGTASADHTAIVWGMHSGKPLLQYTGHSGSVNSVRFHPDKELVLTASGDGTAHIWQCAVHINNESFSGRVASSEDELVDGESGCFALADSFVSDNNEYGCSVLRTPLRSLAGHMGVVIAADWLPGGDQVVTAGWDRLACVWDTQTGQLLHQLSGHDDELTHTSVHPTSRLVVTSSKDSTFRLWDFRECIHSVSVFQGHHDTVTSAIFSKDDLVISGSDDRSVRIWDLRNMRNPLASVHADSSVNRLSISNNGLIAVPFDNRNVRLYDANGQRVGRLPRSARQGHTRMVCSTAWSDDTKPNLFTCGFDRITFGWNVQQNENFKENDTTIGTSLSSNATPNSGPASLEGAKYLPRNGKDVNVTLKESNLVSH